MAAIDRSVNDTIRVEWIFTRRPAGDSHSTRRSSSPVRKSSVRSWECTCP